MSLAQILMRLDTREQSARHEQIPLKLDGWVLLNRIDAACRE